MTHQTDRRAGPPLEELVERAVQSALAPLRVIDAELHEKHHQYLDAILAREATRAKRWEAVIEKSLAGLVWAAIAWIGAMAVAYFKDHWK